MRVTHPDGNTDLFMVDGTQFMAKLEVNGPGWVTVGYLDSDRGLIIDRDEWDAFVFLVGEINEQVLKARQSSNARLHQTGADAPDPSGSNCYANKKLQMNSKQFRAVLDQHMCSNPWPGGDEETIEEWANKKARVFGSEG